MRSRVFTGAGFGTLRLPDDVRLELGQTIALTDDEADTVTAVVLSVTDGTANVWVHWEPRRP